MTWNPDYFSKIGYLGVIFAGVAVVLWLIYWVKPNRLVCTVALALSVGAYFTARINSETHVNRIQADRTEELKKRAAQEKARRKALLDSRGDEVANVRFVEDGASDFLDRAGMDEEDLKYFESQGGFGEPDWKKEKKKRSIGGDDDSLESEIGGGESIGGMNDDEFQDDEESEPIIMVEADLVMANRLDLLNLRTTFVFLFVAIGVFVFDYLRRANLYGKASYPFPLPSSWLNALTPMPALVVSRKRCRKSARGELARLARRGDSFLYLTDDPARLKKLPAGLSKFPFFRWKEEVIPVGDAIDDDFIFETVWYGRSSFASGERAQSLDLLDRFLDYLEVRKKSRARVTQTAHLVWDFETPMSARQRERAISLAEASGFSLLVLRQKSAKPSPTNQTSPESPPIPS